MRSSQTEYQPRLDHLRFLAATLVVAYHYFHRFVPDIAPANLALSLLDEGHTGIGLFMVISGFIFTQLCLGKDIDYWGFIRSRVIRIYPMFVFGVVLSLLISTYNYHRNYGLHELIEWLVPFRSSNVPFSDYFAQLWTIWVEFQFYLLFPFLLVFYRRYGIRYLLLLLLLTFSVRCLVFLDTGSARFISYETIIGRLDQFLIGMLAAVIQRKHSVRFAHPAVLLTASLVLMITIRWFNRAGGATNITTPIWIFWPLAEGLIWAFFLLAYVNLRLEIPKILETGLAKLGEISFSIYVMHNLVLAVLAKHIGVISFIGNPIADAAITSIIVTMPPVLLLSWLTFSVVEKPFLSFRKPYLKIMNDAPVNQK